MTSTSRRRWPAFASLALISWLAATTAPSAASPDPAQIVIKDFMFTPRSLTVKAGTSVVWVNRDDEPHTVVSDAGLFRSGAVDTNDTYAFKFDKPGTYRFSCSIHPRMTGTIVVE